MKIAIIQVDFPIQSYTKDFAEILSENGHEIDIYIDSKTDFGLVNINKIKTKVIIIDKGWKKYLIKAEKILKIVLSKFIRGSLKNHLNTNEFKKFFCYKLIKKNKYQLLLGIEKRGLILAGWIANKLNIKYGYYSLELYIKDHPEYNRFQFFLSDEKKYHNNASLTIIQDELRAAVLSKENGIPMESFVYLPIGVRCLEQKKYDKHFFTKKFNLKDSDIIILNFGNMDKDRGISQLLHTTLNFPDNIFLVFHGIIRDLELSLLNDHVLLSNQIVDENQIPCIISSCHIGLALYNNSYYNDRLTAFSSQKVALYLRSGIPIITFKNESYIKLFQQFSCGIMINDYQDMIKAIYTLLENYDYYSDQARLAFNEIYNLDKTIKNFCNHSLFSIC